jgi:hypothetical protein
VNVQIDNRAEINAVLCGEIIGDAYEDGAVWAEENSLALWRLDQQSAALKPPGAIPGTDAVTP